MCSWCKLPCPWSVTASNNNKEFLRNRALLGCEIGRCVTPSRRCQRRGPLRRQARSKTSHGAGSACKDATAKWCQLWVSKARLRPRAGLGYACPAPAVGQAELGSSGSGFGSPRPSEPRLWPGARRVQARPALAVGQACAWHKCPAVGRAWHASPASRCSLTAGEKAGQLRFHCAGPLPCRLSEF